ncbi:Protein of unknown function DUF3511 [Macleaya cordata]|uniref:DUF3511 domain-containing protein n=1 Tax=Macleaya cordata TaxID=56857 RepID=A0A200QD42_MACCD|nr:Protein of unknown function DUF3511 [Macleaya cordata]
MEDYNRSKFYGEGGMQIQTYQGGRPSSSGQHDFRSYSTSYASSVTQTQMGNKDIKFKKAKSSGSSSKIWCFNDPELQRKKRVASYKVYSVEGKMKGTFRKSFRWIKERYTKVVYGWW